MGIQLRGEEGYMVRIHVPSLDPLRNHVIDMSTDAAQRALRDKF